MIAYVHVIGMHKKSCYEINFSKEKQIRPRIIVVYSTLPNINNDKKNKFLST